MKNVLKLQEKHGSFSLLDRVCLLSKFGSVPKGFRVTSYVTPLVSTECQLFLVFVDYFLEIALSLLLSLVTILGSFEVSLMMQGLWNKHIRHSDSNCTDCNFLPVLHYILPYSNRLSHVKSLTVSVIHISTPHPMQIISRLLPFVYLITNF